MPSEKAPPPIPERVIYAFGRTAPWQVELRRTSVIRGSSALPRCYILVRTSPFAGELVVATMDRLDLEMLHSVIGEELARVAHPHRADQPVSWQSERDG